MRDTSAAVEEEYRQRILRERPARRLAMACRMHSTAKTLVVAGILKLHGALAPSRLREEVFLRFYGRDFDDARRRKILEHLRATGEGPLPDESPR